MIRRVVLSNWRAYDELTLEFDEGVTFVVASNGIGKSSIVMGVAWGLFGRASSIDAVASIRGDAESASVEVLLELSDGRALEISRVVTTKGKIKTVANLDGLPVKDELRLMEETFGADAGVLARLTFMSDGGHIASETEFDLKDHLYQVFGVSALREAETEAIRLRKLATDERAAIRKTERKKAANRAELERALEHIEQELREHDEARSSLEQELKAADKARTAAQQWAVYEESLRVREEQIREIIEATQGVVDSGADSEDHLAAQSLLTDLEDQLRRQVDKQKDEIASHDARWGLARKAIERLQGASAVCPTCLRPISPEEASSAVHEHETTVSSMEGTLDELNAGLNDLKERMATIRQAVRRFQEIPGPPVAPSIGRVDRKEMEKHYSEVMSRLDSLKEARSALRVEGQGLRTQIEDQEQAETAEAAERLAFRREAMALATESALKESAERITRERIDPLTQEVARRWKRLFGTGDLILNPNGTIQRKVGTRELKLNELSGGERIWAQLVTRLLVLTASTRAPFVWLDEPLEHLDPKLRRIVAGTLVRAAESDGLRQIVVTTYEEGLARQLTEDAENAQMTLIRPGDQL